MSTVFHSIVNCNQNSLSTLSVNYIGYFYYVFPLHPNTFHRLFQHSTQPQLEILKSLITYFISLNTDISFSSQNLTSFNEDSNFIFKHIDQSLNILISIDLNSVITYYLNQIRSILIWYIYPIDIILSKSVKYISHIIRFIALYFDVLLEIFYKNFINKLNDHKTSLEANIKCYIEKINQCLEEHSSCVQEFIKSINNIESQIANFIKNYGKIVQSWNYILPTKLIKVSKSNSENLGATREEIKIFDKISNLILEYRNDSHIFDRHKSRFSGIMVQLKHYSTQFVNKTVNYQQSQSGSSIIDPVLNPLQGFKAHVDQFDKNMEWVEKLEKIGEHISIMKFNLSEVKYKMEQGAIQYIEGLCDIEFDPYQVETDIREIKSMNDNIIEMLQITKYSIEFYQSLESEIKNLNDVTFTKYDIPEFLKNSKQIQEKLKHFQEQINKAISNVKKSFGGIQGHTFVMEGDLYTESYYKKLTSPVETLILTTLKEISVIKYIIYYLRIIKLNSKRIDFVKKKINEISNIDTALRNLKEILRFLRIFYHIHINAMNVVILLNFISFVRHSIDEYVNRLRLVKYDIEILIFVIKCYIIILTVIKYVTNKLNEIKQKIPDLISKSEQIKILSTHTLNIKKYLESINSTIKSLESVNRGLDINNLKNNISLVKYHIRKVYQNILVVNVNINEIYKLMSELYNMLSEIIEIQKTVNDIIIEIVSFINYLKTYIIFILYEATLLVSQEKRLVFQIHSNSIFKMIENLVKIGDYLNGINKVIDQMGVKELIQILESQTSSTETLVKKIESNVEQINRGVVDVECAIEGVARNFIKCTLQSSINNTIYSNITSLGVDNRVMSMYSVSGVMDYKALVNRLLESAKKIDNIVDVLYRSYGCFCIESFEKNNSIDPNIGDLGIKQYFFRDKSSDEIYKMKTVQEIKRLYHLNLYGNHFCLCMIIKYVMFPSVINIAYLISFELQTLSTLGRKYERYGPPTTFNSDVIKMLLIIIEMLESISRWVRNNYCIFWTGYTTRVEFRCYCTYNDDRNYHVILNTILVISALIENVSNMNNHSIMLSIECLSVLISEFENIDSQNNKSIINMNIFKLSFVSVLSSSTQSCKILATLRIIIDLISLSKQVRVLESFIRTYILNISLCNIFRFENVIKELKRYDKNPSSLSFSGWVLNKYESLNSPCSGCNKSNCCCSICLNLLIFWIWMCIVLNVNIKLYESNKEYKERLTNLLNCICNCGEDCCCKELKVFCDQICGTNCRNDCICQDLKKTCQTISKPNCNGADKCLCKLIKETIGKCFKGGGCICTNKGCCKIVAQSVRILTRACRANVLEPYKKITLDLIGSSKDKTQLVRNIVNRINNGTVNRISSLKISYSSHPYLNNKNTIESRNWGYDTLHEHYVTPDQSIKQNEGYPHINTIDGTRYDGKRNKMFKLVLSRLLIAVIITGIFIFIRVRYQEVIVDKIDNQPNTESTDDNVDSTELVNYTSNVDQNVRNSTGSSYLVDMFLDKTVSYPIISNYKYKLNMQNIL